MKKTWVFVFALLGLVTWAGAVQAEDMHPVAQEEPAETAAPAIEAEQAVEAIPAAQPTSAEETMPTVAPEPQVEETPAEEKPTMDAVETEAPTAEQAEVAPAEKLSPTALSQIEYLDHLKDCTPLEQTIPHPLYRDIPAQNIIYGRYNGKCLTDSWFVMPEKITPGGKIYDVRCFYDDAALADLTSEVYYARARTGNYISTGSKSMERSCNMYLDGVMEDYSPDYKAPAEKEGAAAPETEALSDEPAANSEKLEMMEAEPVKPAVDGRE